MESSLFCQLIIEMPRFREKNGVEIILQYLSWYSGWGTDQGEYMSLQIESNILSCNQDIRPVPKNFPTLWHPQISP